ncbi:MAG: DUF4440 domain-containing protein [Planctomycetota bacterium]|jgi:hypothetical protein
MDMTELLLAALALGAVCAVPLGRGTAEDLVAGLYSAVTTGAGETPDWDRVRAMFHDQAVIVLRTAPDATSVFTVQGFVDDFVAFIERAGVERTGFTERIVRMAPMVFGDMAHVLVLYEAHLPGSGRAAKQGVDSFSLIRRDGRWWIVAVTNELPTAERPLPEALRDDVGAERVG